MLESALLIFAGGPIALLAFLVCASLSASRRLIVAAFLAVPQFFLSDIPISVADVWLIFMTVLAVLDKRLMRSASWAVWLIMALGGTFVVAQLWSVEPFNRTNLLLILRMLLFGFLIQYAATVYKNNINALRTAIMWASPWVALQGVLILIFIFNPSMEITFLKSQIGHLLVGPDAGALFRGHENNVLDPLKAGGLFVNGNVGSMFCGVAFFVMLMGTSIRPSVWLRIVAVVSMSGAVFSGSKTGIALALVLPLTSLLLYWLSSNRARVAVIPVAVGLIPVVLWLQNALPKFFPDYVSRSEVSLGTRGELWGAAWQLFQNHPIIGLGFGGWEQDAWAVARISGYPPHNFIIATWAMAGFFAAALAIGFLLFVCVSSLHGMVKAESKNARRIVVAGMFAMLWIFFHGMADNTVVYGEFRTMLFAAIATAVATSKIGAPSDSHPKQIYSTAKYLSHSQA